MPMAAATTYQIPTVFPQRYGRAADLYLNPDLGDARWTLDMQVVPAGIPTIRGFNPDPCVEITWALGENFTAADTWTSFRLDESVTCSTLGAWSMDELNEWALREGRNVFSAALARHVQTGAYGAAKSLAAEADDVTAGSVTPTDALAAVEYGLGQRLMAQGMVHMDVAMLTRLASAGAIRLIDGVWYTASGNIVVSDYGYVSGDGADVYIYGSGFVSYVTSGWRTLETGWNPVHNDAVARVTTDVIAWWDPAPVVKARTNVAPVQNNVGV
jgi:hypothetical protein